MGPARRAGVGTSDGAGGSAGGRCAGSKPGKPRAGLNELRVGRLWRSVWSGGAVLSDVVTHDAATVRWRMIINCALSSNSSAGRSGEIIPGFIFRRYQVMMFSLLERHRRRANAAEADTHYHPAPQSRLGRDGEGVLPNFIITGKQAEAISDCPLGPSQNIFPSSHHYHYIPPCFSS